MKVIKLPATLRWALINCLLIWMAMFAYRGLLLSVFRGRIASKFSIFVQGIIVDAGVAGLLLAVFISLTLFRPLHPYKTKTGKVFGYIYFSVWMILISMAYALDVIFLKSIHYRAFGSKLLHLLNDKVELEAFFRVISIMPFVLVIGLVVLVWALLVRGLHGYLGHMARVHNKTKRLTWQGISIILGSILSVFSVITALQLSPSDLNVKTVPWKAFVTNPLLNLFFV